MEKKLVEILKSIQPEISLSRGHNRIQHICFKEKRHKFLIPINIFSLIYRFQEYDRHMRYYVPVLPSLVLQLFLISLKEKKNLFSKYKKSFRNVQRKHEP